MKFALRFILVASSLVSGIAFAEVKEFRLTIKDHRFNPSEITIPANEKVKLLVENLDATPEEFESHSLNREKIIPGKSKAVIYVGPLKPGSYDFFGEFNPKTATGKILVK